MRRATASPVRCAIDHCLTLDASRPAFCIPFNIGRRTQVLVHMLLPVDQTWTESRRQLAQTYCNTACAALMSLHLLTEAEKQSMTDALSVRVLGVRRLDAACHARPASHHLQLDRA